MKPRMVWLILVGSAAGACERRDPAPPLTTSAPMTTRAPADAAGASMTAPIGGLEVRAFAFADRAGRPVVIVEQVYGVGDEGLSASYGSAWRCTAKACEELP